MLSVEGARETILQALEAKGTEVIPFTASLARVLAVDVSADAPLPPFAQSAMDGFAVRTPDTAEATPGRPVSLKVLGTLAAGHLAPWTIVPGTAVRIMTGAPLPGGADAVIKREDTECTSDAVTIFRPARPDEYIIPPGRDIPKGAKLLHAGDVVTAGAVGLFASLGMTQIRVHHRPHVGILALGDELVPPHLPLAPGQIRVSNLYAIAASVAKYGGVPHTLGIAPDRLHDIQAALTQAPDVDLLLTLGGSQRGDFDLVDDLLGGALGRMIFREIAANYARSMIFGRFGRIPLCGLPGSPMTSFVTFEAFVRAAIWKLAGRRILEPPRLEAAVTAPLPATGGRGHFQPVWVEMRPDGFVAIPLPVEKVAELPPQTLANGVIYRPPASPACRAGARVWVEMIEPPSPASCSSSIVG
jgi:molybdopterin molybdotransferase